MRKRQFREIIQLLDLLLEHEESVIETHIVAGTNQAMPEDHRGQAIVAEARTVWRRANGIILKLEGLRRNASA